MMTAILCLTLCAAAMATQPVPGELVRRTLRLADISQKAAALHMGINQGLLARELNGERHLPIDRYLDKLPESFRRWLPVTLAHAYGLPEETQTIRALDQRSKAEPWSA